ncbi:cocaine- and amphetamine-regulated transcript protein-like isoform X3 [Anguilla rostrata]|uniref:cocaine- and amphetamine-regulated transcript protein-like isoform X3 n=1 Tax=Anguilla rostrata TaxID=7938 RepID=UPI0030D12BB2
MFVWVRALSLHATDNGVPRHCRISLPGMSHRRLGALQDVLEKLQKKRIPSWEKKFGQVPTCDVGEQCAVRKGARIGKMCDCPRRAFCNFFLLKCL